MHAALEVTSRFLLVLMVGPRTVANSAAMLGQVARWCRGHWPLLLMDNLPAYPAAILQVLGVVQYRRRRPGKGKGSAPRRPGHPKRPSLKTPPGLLAGVVEKVRDEGGRLLRVRTRRLFGKSKDLVRQIRRLGIGRRINTSYLERLNGTLRCQQPGRLGRRSRGISKLPDRLADALALWHNCYNWLHRHAGLSGRTPAMALGLAQRPWNMHDYLYYPVHVGPLQRQTWQEEHRDWLTPATIPPKRLMVLPIS